MEGELKMLFSEESIIALIGKLESQDEAVDAFEIKCQKQKGASHGYVDTCLFKGDGEKGWIVDEDYYGNLEAHLSMIQMGWLDFFYKDISKNPVTVYGSVTEDGEVGDNMRLEVKIKVPERDRHQPMMFLRNIFTTLSKYSKYILNCEISSVDYAISSIKFDMMFSTREMMKTIRKTTPNMRTVTQWLVIYDEILQEIDNKYSLTYNVRLLEGKMDFNRMRKKVTLKFVEGIAKGNQRKARG